MAIYLPLLVFELFAVTLLAYNIFKTPRAYVSIHNTALTVVGLLTVEYFIFIVAKDTGIFIS